MKSEVQRVLGEHRLLDHAADELERIVKSGRRRASDAFEALSRFASSLAEHLLNEADVLPSATRAGPLDDDLNALKSDWNEYLSAWDEELARRDWERFAQHSLSILARVRARIRTENNLILCR